MEIIHNDRRYVVRTVVMRLDMSTARFQGGYHLHHFKGTNGVSPKLLEKQNNDIYMFEYASRPNIGGVRYAKTLAEAPMAQNTDSMRIQGTVWGLSVYCYVPKELARKHPSVDPDTQQTFRRVHTWKFIDPVRIKRGRTERGRWLSMTNHHSEQIQLALQTALASGERIKFIPSGVVDCIGVLPGMEIYNDDRDPLVERSGALPGF